MHEISATNFKKASLQIKCPLICLFFPNNILHIFNYATSSSEHNLVKTINQNVLNLNKQFD